MKQNIKWISALIISLFLIPHFASALTRGIYITQSTAQNSSKLNTLIDESKKFKIDSFVIDVNQTPNKIFSANVKRVIANGIHFVARLVIFPHGGTHDQVTDKKIWAKRLALAKEAVALGASAIQLDYIRYQAENPANPTKAQHILKVVRYFKDELAAHPVTLQMDIFGVAALKPAHTIGQDVSALGAVIHTFCPMVYPSHYEPFRFHALHPYETIFHSVSALKKQLVQYPDVTVYAYIELYNYRFPLSPKEKSKYIAAEMKAAVDAGANGWYVWSPNNHYAPLFAVLSEKNEMQ